MAGEPSFTRLSGRVLPLVFILLAVVVSMFPLSACGSGDSGSPTQSVPPSLPTVAGTYSGIVVFRAADPTNHCFSEGLALVDGHGFRMTVELEQDETRLEGVLEGVDIVIVCEFRGTVDIDGSVEWTQTSCSDAEEVFDWSREAEQDCRLRVRRVDHAFEGRALGTELTGDLTITWETFDGDTGASLGTVEIDANVDIQKAIS